MLELIRIHSLLAIRLGFFRILGQIRLRYDTESQVESLKVLDLLLAWAEDSQLRKT